jgi:hypothetical protein
MSPAVSRNAQPAYPAWRNLAHTMGASGTRMGHPHELMFDHWPFDQIPNPALHTSGFRAYQQLASRLNEGVRPSMLRRSTALNA